MTWRVIISGQARRDLRSLDPSVAQRVLRAIDRLATTGRADLKRLHGTGEQWRLRVGDWRVRLVLDTPAETIRVLRVRHRREAYRE